MRFCIIICKFNQAWLFQTPEMRGKTGNCHVKQPIFARRSCSSFSLTGDFFGLFLTDFLSFHPFWKDVQFLLMLLLHHVLST